MNVARYTSERLEDLCKTELRSTIETFDSACTETFAVSEHAHNIGHKPLWNKVKFIDRDLITIHIRSKRQFTYDFTLTTSTGIVE